MIAAAPLIATLAPAPAAGLVATRTISGSRRLPSTRPTKPPKKETANDQTKTAISSSRSKAAGRYLGFILELVNEEQSNAELVVETLAAYQRGDDETVRAGMHPDVEVYSEPGMINSGSYAGFEGFKQWASQWEEAWEEITYEPVEFIDVDDARLVVRTHVTGRGAGSGLEIDRDFAFLYEIEDGRATRFHLYESVENAVDAAHRMARE